jgi:hypothetical protein
VSVGIVVSFSIFKVVPQSPTKIPSEFPSLLPTDIPSVITVEFYRRKYFISNLVAGNFFFGALIHPSVFPSILFFFIIDRNGDEIRITDDHDSDGINPSEIPSVIVLPTFCVPYTNGNHLSVKLYNGVVIVVGSQH